MWLVEKTTKHKARPHIKQKLDVLLLVLLGSLKKTKNSNCLYRNFENLKNSHNGRL